MWNMEHTFHATLNLVITSLPGGLTLILQNRKLRFNNTSQALSLWVAELMSELMSILAAKRVSLYTLPSQQGILHFGNDYRKKTWVENNINNFNCTMAYDRSLFIGLNITLQHCFSPILGYFFLTLLSSLEENFFNNNHKEKHFTTSKHCFTVVNLKHKWIFWVVTQCDKTKWTEDVFLCTIIGYNHLFGNYLNAQYVVAQGLKTQPVPKVLNIIAKF